MSAFTEAELAYLTSQHLMRFATASSSGKPDVAPVTFGPTATTSSPAASTSPAPARFRNVAANPRATVVIDDLASVDPWTPRGVKVIGSVRVEDRPAVPHHPAGDHISWGINEIGQGRHGNAGSCRLVQGTPGRPRTKPPTSTGTSISDRAARKDW